MRILFNIRPKEPWGGSFIFTKHLIRCSEELGHRVVFDVQEEHNVALLSSWWGGAALLDALKVPFVHRMDGLRSVYSIPDETDLIQKEFNDHSVYTIYQSRYSKESSSRLLDVTRPHDVILNGTDLDLFYPKRFRFWRKLRVVASSWSNNEGKGFALMERLSRVRGIEFTFVGRWNESFDASSVRLVSALRQRELARLLGSQDVFFAPSRNDPCSNSLIEGIASGLIPLYLDSGGHPEIVGGSGLVISDLERNVEEIGDRRRELREKSVLRRKDLDIRRIGVQYLRILERFAENANQSNA